MNGRKAKQLRRLNKAEDDAKRIAQGQASVFDAALAIPADMIITYITLKFIGMSGYRYASIGRYNSLFNNAESADIVPITFHRDRPIVTVRGGYHDPQNRDTVLIAVHVPTTFQGFVVDRDGTINIGSSSDISDLPTLMTMISPDNSSFEFKKVITPEFDAALKKEAPFIESQMAALAAAVKETKKKGEDAIAAMEKKFDKDELERRYGRTFTDKEADTVRNELLINAANRGILVREDGTAMDSKGRELSAEERAALEELIYAEVGEALHLTSKVETETPVETPVV